MSETKPSDSYPKPTGSSRTPAPKSPASDEASPLDTSLDDPLAELLDAERQAEAWFILSRDTIMRASEIRRITVGPTAAEVIEENGERFEATWPVPGLFVNGELVTHPLWSLPELIKEIGVDVVESPEKDRTWTKGRKVPKSE